MPRHDAIDLPRLPPRDPQSQKNDFGRAMVIGGSVGMSGAASLAGVAALRSGAGLVTIATAEPCLPVVAAFEPACMTAELPADSEGRISYDARTQLKSICAPAIAVACGPGLGRSESLERLVTWLYGDLKQPAVFDADALFALAGHPDALSRSNAVRILTPHMGEFARLVPTDDDSREDDSREVDSREKAERLAVDKAAEWNAIVVLKGHNTLVTDGRRQFRNPTGNPGMATGGTGDVLTGVIVGLLSQGLDPFDAAQLGVYLHGLAGDLAAAALGQTSLIASDLLDFLPAAFQQHAG